MIKYFFSIITLIAFYSCSTSFNNGFTNGNSEKLNQRNISQLNGTYEIFASGKYNENGRFTAVSTNKKKYSFYNKIENKLPNMKIKDIGDIGNILKNPPIDSIPSLTSNYEAFEVKIKPDGYLTFNFLKNDQIATSLTCKGNIKDGFIYLPKEKNCTKIYSSKNCVISQRRIGLAEDGSIILQESNKVDASSQTTSVLLSLFEGNGENAYKYKKIN